MGSRYFNGALKAAVPRDIASFFASLQAAIAVIGRRIVLRPARQSEGRVA